MNPELKTKWVAALRSGEYQQTARMLFNPATGGYCCLGVLCEVANPGSIKEKITLGWSNSEFSTIQLGEFDKGDFGLGEDIRGDLADRNDGRRGERSSFAEIADYIERNL